MLTVNVIGSHSTIPDWPQPTVEGIFDALRRWTLDPRWARDHGLGDPNDNLAGPFRGSAWCGCYGRYDQAAGGTRYLATKPIYPDYPEAVNYTGTFLGYSWCFNLDTTQAELILKLDTAIQVNMQTEKYLQARKSIAASRNTGCSTPLNNSA